MKNIFLILSVTGALYAQILGVQECIQKALKTHPDIQAYALKVEQEDKNVIQEKALKRPHIALYGEYDPQRTYVMPLNGAFHTLNDSGWSIGASLSQNLYDFSKTSHKIKSAKIRHKIAQLTLEEAKALIRYKIRLTYATLVLQQEAIKVRKQDIEAKQALYAQAKALVREGLKTKADASRFMAALYRSKEALSLAKANFEKAKIRLEHFIGEKIPSNMHFDNNILMEKREYPIQPLEIFDKNYQIKIAQSREKSALELYRAKRAERFGSIDLVAEANHFDTLSRYDTTTLGIRYKVSLYSGGAIKTQIEQSKIAALVAAKEKDAKKLAIDEEVASIKVDLEQIQQQIAARKAQIQWAQETRNLIEARYEQGLATYMEVLDAQAVWLDAKLGLLESYFNRAQSIYRLEYLYGK